MRKEYISFKILLVFFAFFLIVPPEVTGCDLYHSAKDTKKKKFKIEFSSECIDENQRGAGILLRSSAIYNFSDDLTIVFNLRKGVMKRVEDFGVGVYAILNIFSGEEGILPNVNITSILQHQDYKFGLEDEPFIENFSLLINCKWNIGNLLDNLLIRRYPNVLKRLQVSIGFGGNLNLCHWGDYKTVGRSPYEVVSSESIIFRVKPNLILFAHEQFTGNYWARYRRSIGFEYYLDPSFAIIGFGGYWEGPLLGLGARMEFPSLPFASNLESILRR